MPTPSRLGNVPLSCRVPESLYRFVKDYDPNGDVTKNLRAILAEAQARAVALRASSPDGSGAYA